MQDLPLPRSLFTISEDPHSGAHGTTVIAVLWRGRIVILSCVFACLVIAAIYLAKAPRVYGATAHLLIQQNGGHPFSVANADATRPVEGADEAMATHAMILRSPLVVGKAIESIGLEGLPSLRAAEARGRKPLQVAIANLSVTRPDRQARVIQVDYRCGSQKEAVQTVGAILASYRSFLEDADLKNNGEIVALITKARDELSGETRELERKYLEFRQQAPALTNDGTGHPFINRRIDEWDRAANEATVKAVRLKAQLELGQELAREGAGLRTVAHAMEQLGGGASGQDSRSLVLLAGEQPSDYLRLLAQEQQQVADRLGPDSTRAREIQEQIDQIKEKGRELRGGTDRGEVGELLASIRKSLASIEQMRVEMVDRFEKDLVLAKATEIDLLTERNLRGSMERQQSLFNTVVDQLKQARLAGDYGSIRAKTIEPPTPLSKPVKPVFSLTLALATAAGLFLGAGVTLGKELLDPNIRSLAEMRSILQLPVLGTIPRLPADQSRRTGPVGLLSYTMPWSPAAEAFKVARANLDLACRGRGIKVLLVTGVTSGDGKTMVASNLAISLAQAGRRVLLVDADLRNPAMHDVHELPREPGLVAILQGQASVSRGVQATRVKNLEILTCGPSASNPAELLSSPRLHDILEDVRRDYDTIVVDAPSLLAVADPSILGAVADGILLTVRATGTRREDASRSMEILGALGTPVLGAVINGAQLRPQAPPGGPAASAWRASLHSIQSDLQLSFSPTSTLVAREADGMVGEIQVLR